MENRSRKEFLKSLGLLGSIPFLPLDFSPTDSRNEPSDLPNIVFLLSDDQSQPDLGCYGNPAIQTPHLDRLAEEGMIFNRAYVTSSSCSPSRGSVMTGRSPHATGSTRLHIWTHPEMADLLSLLKQQGYHIGGYRKLHQDNYKPKFDFFGDEEEPFETFFEQRPEDQPFYLWFGSHDPHRPYEEGIVDSPHDPAEVVVPDFLPDTPGVREDLASYYNHMTRFDADCGKLIDLLDEHGLTENTMVVMSSDNGMPFPRAKATVYEAGIKVPLLVKWPGHIQQEGSATDELVSLMDLTATWLDMAGIEVPETMEGRSLLPLLTGGEYTSREYVFAGRNWHDNWSPARAVIGKRYKLIQNYRLSTGYLPSLDIQEWSESYQAIRSLKQEGKLEEPLTWYENTTTPQQEVYDLDSDPGEWNNRADDESLRPMVHELEGALSDWMNDTHDFLPPPHNAYGEWTSVYDEVNPLDGRLPEDYQR